MNDRLTRSSIKHDDEIFLNLCRFLFGKLFIFFNFIIGLVGKNHLTCDDKEIKAA